MIFPLEQTLFFLLTILSHIGASLFFARPRFGKVTTAMIWLLYGVVFLVLPVDTPTFSFFISFIIHLVLFFVTTTGQAQEKAFLFLGYACIHTCTNTIFTIANTHLQGFVVKIVFAVILIALMQLLLYIVLLPSFRRVIPYVRSGWGKFYAVAHGFFTLIVAQAVFPIISPLTQKEVVVFLLTTLAFCITYLVVFTSMKNMMELDQEKRKQLHADLLLSQVQAQAKEFEVMRQYRHDIRQHYNQMLSYAGSGDLEKISDYLKRQTERIENLTSERFCENETVNNILCVYHQKANEQNIAIRIVAAAKPDLTTAAPDLVAIIANILENALHGAAQSGSAEPFIHVNIKHKAQRFVVSCDNSCIPSLDFDEMPETLQGIGIQSIITTADHYGGSYLFRAKDGVFHSTVIMDE